MTHPPTALPLMEPFRYSPSNGAVSGAAFSATFKAIATLIVAGCIVWFFQLRSRNALAGYMGGNGTGWFVAGLCIMAWTWWSIMVSRTRIDAHGLHQRWLWNKSMAFDDLAYVRLIRVRGLAWLIAPRLYVRTLAGKFTVFYAATPELIQEFERIGAQLGTFRRM